MIRRALARTYRLSIWRLAIALLLYMLGIVWLGTLYLVEQATTGPIVSAPRRTR